MTNNKTEKDPIIPTSFKVELFEWTNKIWNGKKFVKINIKTLEGDVDVLLWPNEANCMADMIRQTLVGVDISYDTEKAYEDAVQADGYTHLD